MPDPSPAEQNPGARPAVQQGGTPQDQPKHFTQEEVNRFLADHKRSLQETTTQQAQTIEELRTQIAAANEKLGGFQQFIEQFQEEPDPAPAGVSPEQEYEHALAHPPSWVKTKADQRSWENMCSRSYLENQRYSSLTQSLDELKKERDAERKLRETAEQERKEIELSRRMADRDAKLLALATDPEVNAVSGDAVVRYFKDDLVWNEKIGQWLYRAPDGKFQALDVGIKAHFPDWMRKPSVVNGGSGSGGAGTVTDPQAEIKAARDKVEAMAKAAYGRANNVSQVAEYQKAKKELAALEARYAQKAA